MNETSRRNVLLSGAGLLATAACTPTTGAAAPAPKADGTPAPGADPASERKLGRTGATVERVSLGGEGILRTHGRSREAVPMILEALALGVRYCDTAPAYASSQDYYGAAFREAGPGARAKVFLATKTHERSRDGSLRLLDDSLKRIGTTWVDLWQLHDLRTQDDLDEIFAPDGALAAALAAKADGRVKNIGITGHHDPAILVEAMRRHPFDTVLAAMNPADGRRLPFLTTVIPEARRRGMGVIGMKALAHGELVRDGALTPAEGIRYAAAFADTVIIGCSSPAEVRENLTCGRRDAPLDERECRALEARLASRAARYDTFKRA
ncbi:MAG: aldo/keto reductase [Polyangiaceae bacterium]